MGLIVETDLGRDPDDLFTLIWLIEHEIEIKAITITPGDRDQIAIARFLNWNYQLNIPIGVPTLTRDKKSSGGVHYKLLNKRKFELEGTADGIGSDIIASVYDEKDEILIIGPCTNIGAWLKDRTHTIKRATMQGGFLPCDMPKFAGMSYCPTFNLNGDRKAGQIFLDHPIKYRQMVGKNVCHGVVMTENKFTGGLNKELADLYLDGHDGKKMHDPVAALCHIFPDLGVWARGKTIKVGSGWGTDLSRPDDYILEDINKPLFERLLYGQE